MTYKYETHLHTSQGSACAVSTGAEMVDYYKTNGYSGFVVTDHFMNGNTAVDKSLPWKEQVDAFCLGYEDAKKRGDEIDFDVFFGFEFNYKGTEFLIYGLDKNWLKQNEIITHTNLKSALQNIRRGGGTIIHAHPFRAAPYISVTRLVPEYTDAIEIKNWGNTYSRCNFLHADRQDDMAEMYAEMYGKPMISGTDTHSAQNGSKIIGGVLVNRRLSSITELADTIKNNDFTMLWE